MRLCPRCGGAMVVAQTITVGGLENKDIAWRCEYDGVMAELRHPGQYVHLTVGDIDDADGRPRRRESQESSGAGPVADYEAGRESGTPATVFSGRQVTVPVPA